MYMLNDCGVGLTGLSDLSPEYELNLKNTSIIKMIPFLQSNRTE